MKILGSSTAEEAKGLGTQRKFALIALGAGDFANVSLDQLRALAQHPTRKMTLLSPHSTWRMTPNKVYVNREIDNEFAVKATTLRKMKVLFAKLITKVNTEGHESLSTVSHPAINYFRTSGIRKPDTRARALFCASLPRAFVTNSTWKPCDRGYESKLTSTWEAEIGVSPNFLRPKYPIHLPEGKGTWR